MDIYAAPLEGLTGYIYRRAHHDFFPGAKRYYTPFIMPGQKTLLRSKEARDVLPEHNAGLEVVPQLLTNQAADFLQTASALAELGYREVNLNLGCPSGTVASKHRGAGFLALPEALDAFFEEIFTKTPVTVSVKTRIGVESADELPRLMDIFNRYPIAELTVHPRLQRQKYRGVPDLEAFAYALSVSRASVCYNGDLFTPGDVTALGERFPAVEAVMLGRGLVADPALIGRLAGESCGKERLRAFHDRLLADYGALNMGNKNLLYRMKEIWFYMSHLFAGSEKDLKAINKSQRLTDYLAAVDTLFERRELLGESSFRGTP